MVLNLSRRVGSERLRVSLPDSFSFRLGCKILTEDGLAIRAIWRVGSILRSDLGGHDLKVVHNTATTPATFLVERQQVHIIQQLKIP